MATKMAIIINSGGLVLSLIFVLRFPEQVQLWRAGPWLGVPRSSRSRRFLLRQGQVLVFRPRTAQSLRAGRQGLGADCCCTACQLQADGGLPRAWVMPVSHILPLNHYHWLSSIDVATRIRNLHDSGSLFSSFKPDAIYHLGSNYSWPEPVVK